MKSRNRDSASSTTQTRVMSVIQWTIKEEKEEEKEKEDRSTVADAADAADEDDEEEEDENEEVTNVRMRESRAGWRWMKRDKLKG